MSQKGSNFERETCRDISMWYSNGEHDDWYWRTAMSGGMATVRGRIGKTTTGHYGDITATCPEAASLTKLCCIELKIGYGDWDILDVIDCLKDGTRYPIDDFLDQALEQHRNARTKWAILIFKKDRRDKCICFQSGLYERLAHHFRKPELDRYLTFRRNENEDPWIVMKLDKFFSWARPEYFKNQVPTVESEKPVDRTVRFTRRRDL